MKKITLFLACIALITCSLSVQYNKLWIPDTLSGKTFNLTLKDTFFQIRTGQQTITGGVNGKFWGPTLFINKGRAF